MWLKFLGLSVHLEWHSVMILFDFLDNCIEKDSEVVPRISGLVVNLRPSLWQYLQAECTPPQAYEVQLDILLIMTILSNSLRSLP